MAFNVRVVGGVLDQSEKQRLIEGITELVIEVEGNQDFRQYCPKSSTRSSPGCSGSGERD